MEPKLQENKENGQNKEDPFINQIIGLLDAKEFNTVFKIIKFEFENKKPTLQQLINISQIIDQAKQQANAHNQWMGLSLFGKPPIISNLDSLMEQVVAAKKALAKPSSSYGATQG